MRSLYLEGKILQMPSGELLCPRLCVIPAERLEKEIRPNNGSLYPSHPYWYNNMGSRFKVRVRFAETACFLNR